MVIVVFCLFWFRDIYVTALSSDTKDIGSEDPLSIPLISDKGAPLVAMLDTKTINRKIKVYIRTLMRSTIRNSEQEELQDVLKTSLNEDSTKDLIRNITLLEMNDILVEQGRNKLFHPVNNEEKRKLQYPKDCTTIHNHNPEATSGVHTIYPVDEKAERVYCDME
ncbi:Hypothetical predicted protein [Mytilus galloprovincialis]|uniref:Fibrinogen C-terminal domain-containing protein n=1 Tax=Mytilus galloprovincialis TaxID=29158 RepID=A0A8B6H3Z2_MYTGA|nr:Hypothetical predicted protein [Mytilus galloprovincialis]